MVFILAECCIFHKQREFGNWSDEDDSDAEGCDCQELDHQPQQPQLKPSGTLTA